MLGTILGLGCAAVHGVNSVLIRRGLLWASSKYVANITIFTGLPFFLLVARLTGDIFKVAECPWQAYILFAFAGVVEFALGRTWAFRSVQLIGATRSNVVTSLNIIVTIILAMVILGETVTPLMIAGIFLSLSGPLLITVKESTAVGGAQSRANHGAEVDRRTLYKGILYGMGTAVFRGCAAVSVKLALDSGGPPVLGNLVAYLAACIAISPSSFLGAENRKEMFKAPQKAWRLALVSGITTGIAQLLKNLALKYGSVIVVSLMQRTIPIWVLLFAFTFNRKYESLSRWVLLGNGALMAGSLLVLIS